VGEILGHDVKTAVLAECLRHASATAAGVPRLSHASHGLGGSHARRLVPAALRNTTTKSAMATVAAVRRGDDRDASRLVPSIFVLETNGCT
jgi:hypothetical protein